MICYKPWRSAINEDRSFLSIFSFAQSDARSSGDAIMLAVKLEHVFHHAHRAMITSESPSGLMFGRRYQLDRQNTGNITTIPAHKNRT